MLMLQAIASQVSRTRPMVSNHITQLRVAHREYEHLLLAVLDLASLQAVRGHYSICFALARNQIFEPLLSLLREPKVTKALAATEIYGNLGRSNCR